MNDARKYSMYTLLRDTMAGMVVFLVALPLCLGIANASNAPLISGLITGIVGGVLVGLLSGSHTSVSGPAAGLTVVVATQINQLGSYQAFLLAVLIAGVIQCLLGLLRAGFISAYFPTSVIKGLLAAIGLILILKQIPHLIGRDTDPVGQEAFLQPDQQNTFTEIWQSLSDPNLGASIIGLSTLLLIVVWENLAVIKKTKVPGPLIVVVIGVAINLLFKQMFPDLVVNDNHMVKVPVADGFNGIMKLIELPDFSAWSNPALFTAAITIAIVASLETLLNLEAVDKLDPEQRHSPASRELFAQGIGNIVAGLLGGLPMTSVIVRSSANINAGAKTKVSAVIHGLFLFVAVVLVPHVINQIPLACLASILLYTGYKLASPKLIKQMWHEGYSQFLPFVCTVVAIVMTDLLIGIMIGLAVSIGFILRSNMRNSLRRVKEKHIGGDVLRIELANQMSFLNRASLMKVLMEQPRGTHVLIDARSSDYIDPDIMDLITDFKNKAGPAHDVTVSMIGFKDKYDLNDEILFVDYSTQEIQSSLTPDAVINILLAGNERFRTGQRLDRDLNRLIHFTAEGQHPLAVVMSCIDSRSPVELIFDLALGDVFTIRVAGNVIKDKVLASMEYSCAVAGAKVVLVLGHTRCGAVRAALDLWLNKQDPKEATGCQHLGVLVDEIQKSIEPAWGERTNQASNVAELADELTRRHIFRMVKNVYLESQTLARLANQNKIKIVGGVYDICTGRIQLLDSTA